MTPAGDLQPNEHGFLTTHWSVVLQARGDSPAARDALETLCRSYWRPLYAFVRREGYRPEEAEDLTQEFFARFLARKDFETPQREKGRLRSYLLVSLKHFLSNQRDCAVTIKRGRGQVPFSLEEMRESERFDLEPSDKLTAEQIYERRWANAVLDQVLARLEGEYRTAAKKPLFARLKLLLIDEPGHPSQLEIAQELQMTENAVKQAFHRLRVRYREILREQIAHTVATVAEIEDELRYLITVLRT